MKNKRLAKKAEAAMAAWGKAHNQQIDYLLDKNMEAYDGMQKEVDGLRKIAIRSMDNLLGV